MSGTEFNSAESFSAEYGEFAYDDVRKVGGLWYYRDPATKEIRAFPFQNRVTLLCKNISVQPSATVAGTAGSEKTEAIAPKKPKSKTGLKSSTAKAS